jgi:hypothetical protein
MDRAERRRQTRQRAKIVRVPIEELYLRGCAWNQCGATCEYSDPLPYEWRHIVLASGSPLDRQNILSGDRDGLLCPEHFNELHTVVLKPLQVDEIEITGQ